ncbi:MAG: alginate lyase family protein [Opitutaceae bacterium]|nr:alginate lyase family protein [Opitutaceae bacterium]
MIFAKRRSQVGRVCDPPFRAWSARRAGHRPALLQTIRLALLCFAAVLVAPAAEAPRTFALDARDLVANRVRLARGDAALAREVAALRAEADQLLELKPASVLDSPGVAASGDPHDYYSAGPYWWPDPTKPDGLPYIQRDGVVNPESRASGDMLAFRRTGESVRTLGLAYFFTADERYAQKAAQLTRVWFLDPATRMNPNFQHAQGIPGRSPGRGTGLIEARHLMTLNDGLALLAGSRAWPAADATAMRAWLAEFYGWLTTSKNAADESVAENNHGSWFAAQVAHLALVLGRTNDAKKIIETVRTERIPRQIEPDGSQPHELRRTRSLNYVLFNLEALTLLARLGDHVGVDLWGFATPDGRSLRAALRVAAPYVDPAKVWPKEDVSPENRARVLPLLVEALRHGDDPGWRDLLARFGGAPAPGEHWRLWWAARP